MWSLLEIHKPECDVRSEMTAAKGFTNLLKGTGQSLARERRPLIIRCMLT